MDPTTDPTLRSFVDVPPDSDFPLQNLPYGVFTPVAGEPARVGVALGDYVLDLSVLEQRGLLGAARSASAAVFNRPSLNAFMACGPGAWHTVRAAVSRLLRADEPTLRDDPVLRRAALIPRADVRLRRPCAIGDYTDFYASLHHASNVGRIFRGPDAALPPNYRELPIGYHGRASSIVMSGALIRRPLGQFRVPDQERPVFGPTRQLDFELEVGALIGVGNSLGQPIPIEHALWHVFGLVLVNDWSARDIQQWEYTPLGPFLGKNFGTTISPWVVPLAALQPFRCAGPAQEPRPLHYLRAERPGAFNVALDVAIQTTRMAAPHVISRTNFAELYWSFPQMIAHHTVGGCNLRPGDLLASGTISGPTPDSLGSLLELAWRGARPVELPSGETRAFVEDGDTIVLHGAGQGAGYRVGFGECRGTVLPANSA